MNRLRKILDSVGARTLFGGGALLFFLASILAVTGDPLPAVPMGIVGGIFMGYAISRI